MADVKEYKDEQVSVRWDGHRLTYTEASGITSSIRPVESLKGSACLHYAELEQNPVYFNPERLRAIATYCQLNGIEPYKMEG